MRISPWLLATGFLVASAPLHAHSDTPRPAGSDPAPAAAPIVVARPPVENRSAYVTQIGDGNRATIRQGTGAAYAAIRQTGERQRAEVIQRAGIGYVDLRQSGLLNDAFVTQNGAGGHVMLVSQSGTGNIVRAVASAVAGGELGASIAQSGDRNQVVLQQEGSDNHARLVQVGDNNRMNVHQLAANNSLEWTQMGNDIAGGTVIQDGNQAMRIYQTK